MRFIERHLMPGEILVYRARLHWARLLPHFVLMLLFAAALVVVSVKVGGFWSYLPLAALVYSCLRALGAYIVFTTADFAVTTHRVIVKRGLFTLRSTEILIPRIESIQVEQSIWGRVLNYGTVVIIGTGGTHEAFEMIAGPYELRNQVQAELAGSPGQPLSPKKPPSGEKNL